MSPKGSLSQGSLAAAPAEASQREQVPLRRCSHCQESRIFSAAAPGEGGQWVAARTSACPCILFALGQSQRTVRLCSRRKRRLSQLHYFLGKEIGSMREVKATKVLKEEEEVRAQAGQQVVLQVGAPVWRKSG